MHHGIVSSRHAERSVWLIWHLRHFVPCLTAHEASAVGIMPRPIYCVEYPHGHTLDVWSNGRHAIS